MKKRPEILAPAGSRESLIAAVRCGADAVYLGGSAFSARQGARNFDRDELAEAVSYAHERGIRVFLALNTIVFDRELNKVSKAIEHACACGIDALIVQDLAVASIARRCAPQLPLHASTQMSVHNLHGAKQLEAMGFKRVILAREMSRDEIACVVQNTGLEIECFVHGALCMSLSGQCSLSAVLGGRSGNRGACAQPCRLPFSPSPANGASHALSLKDLSLIPHIPVLADLGVYSLKIEGRMKRPEYVAAAVTACRDVLDGREPDLDVLESIFSRSGFTDGYHTGSRGAGMYGMRRREDVAASQKVLKHLAGLYRKERPAVPVQAVFSMTQNSPSVLCLTDSDGNDVTVTGAVPQTAVSAPTTPARAEELLQKTGGTPYLMQEIRTNLETGLMLPASEINLLRRQALEQLSLLRAAPRPIPFLTQEWIREGKHTAAETPALRIRLQTPEQMTDRIVQQADSLILPLEALEQNQNLLPDQVTAKLIAELPPAWFDDVGMEYRLQRIFEQGVLHIMTGNIGGIHLGRQPGVTVHGDTGLNAANTLSLREYESIQVADLTVSLEADLSSIRSMGGRMPRGILAYGRLPLMVLRNCPIRAHTDCSTCRDCVPHLTDRLGNRFPLLCRGDAAVLHNCVPLYLGDRKKELRALDFLTLYFTTESPQRCEQVLNLFLSGSALDETFTRGPGYRRAGRTGA